MALFQPGQSGNPGGRPRALIRVRELAREHTEAAIAALVKILKKDGAQDQAVIAAAVALLDRGWGRPTQPISGDEDMPPVNFDVRERVVGLIDALHQKLASGEAGGVTTNGSGRSPSEPE